MKTKALLFLLTLFFSNCADEPVGQTKLILNSATDGLEVTVTGNVANSSHAITDFTIDWGDAGAITQVKSGFDSISETYKYSDEGIYDILATATNSVGDTATEQLIITVSFKETSLAGIRQTLHKTSADEYLFLTLNLHTYQEEAQLEKLNMVIT